MIRYDIDYKKLALMLTPIVLRKQLHMAYQYLLISPISRMAKAFDNYREETNYRLRHNGQVCHLRAVLNDMFDSGQRRITIEDLEPQKSLYLHERATGRFLMARPRAVTTTGGALLISKRGFGSSNGFDFVVVCPAALRGQIDETRMRAIVDQYKLASKRYTITYM